MSTESELMQKRREVREEILALKEQIPTARIFNRLGKAFRPESLGYWLSSIGLLHLFLIGPVLLIVLLFKEIEKLILFIKYPITATELVIFGLVITHVAAQFTLDDIANRIVEKISNANDLSKLILWLKQTWSLQRVFEFALPFCLLWTSLGTVLGNVLIDQFAGFGYLFWCVADGLLAGIMLYISLWVSLFVSKLEEYQYDMNTFSPAESEILGIISDLLTKNIYLIAGYTSIVSLLSVSSLFNTQSKVLFSFPILIIAWAIILVQFLLTRSTLRAITNRAKWKTLNRIKEKINAIEATGDLSDKDTAERLFRLGDIHKQIMASNTKTFDLKSVTTLFSQLMLPLLGLLLGNLDRVLDLLQK